MNEDAFPRRKRIRLPEFDYGGAGSYFITGCAKDMRHLFGHIRNGVMCLNQLGALVWEEWQKSFEMRPHYIDHAFIVMPNHFHGLLSITRPPADSWNRDRIWQFAQPPCDTVGTMIGGMKSAITSRAAKELGIVTEIFQGRFYDHVVRDEADFDRIEQYILSNTRNWRNDRFHP